MIPRLLKMKGQRRIVIKDDPLSEKILRAVTPGIDLIFLESKIKEGVDNKWLEYSVLLGSRKTGNPWEDTVTLLDSVSQWMNGFEDYPEIGIQEVDTTRSGYNYILMYIIGDEQGNV